VLQEAILIALIAAYMAWETESFKPKPYSLGNGDTLMVRARGYGFCPDNCDTDHFHVGHKKGYNCETKVCNHIIYEDRLN
jgi:hypothetical protein|tara:strand:+ start:155 stop:394 length:240 start_codon:yes stop_codon:yes gene_type:complete